jgi:uncharacterized membrane protein (Fun14 family)
MSQILTPFIYQTGAGVAGGFLVGYAIKKVLKVLMIVFGLSFIAVSYLGLSGMMSINYEKIVSVISGFVIQASGFLSTAIGSLPFTSTFLAGLAFGIMKG